MTYRLSRPAVADLVAIYMKGDRQFGSARADAYHADLMRTFELIGRHPLMARERTEITPPVRTHPHGSHVIVYEIDADAVRILRVRHSREDWSVDPVGEGGQER